MHVLKWWFFALITGLSGIVWAQSSAIYSCVTTSGSRVTSDRPISNCQGSEQRVLNRDGSVRRIERPLPTIAERQAKLLREREEASKAESSQTNTDLAQGLLARFPNKVALDSEREKSLQPWRDSLFSAQQRLRQLQATREKTIQEQKQVLASGKKLSVHTSAQLELFEQHIKAQEQVIAQLNAEILRISNRYIVMLARLNTLW